MRIKAGEAVREASDPLRDGRYAPDAIRAGQPDCPDVLPVSLLELIRPGDVQPFDLFPGHRKPNTREVYEYWETGALLDGLARCEEPATGGLQEGPFSLQMHDDPSRLERYKQSRLSLTELGAAVLARRDDFSGHNRIQRWWGGTELTNDQLWRWDPDRRKLVRP